MNELSTISEVIRTEYSTQFQEHREVEGRLNSLRIDLRRNLDAQKLKQLGSELEQAKTSQVCPTCHQPVTAELLPVVSGVGMALEENISFVRSQIDMYEAIAANSKEQLTDYNARYESVNSDLREAQQEIRSLRQSLLQPTSSPSRALIEELVRNQVRLGRLQSIQEVADSAVDGLRQLADSWTSLQERLRRLSQDDLTGADLNKVSALQGHVQEHLTRYGFRSFQPAEISLSHDNFRPLARTRQDGEDVEKEINFEVSASDAIRLKWAYYLSLLEVSRETKTNHAGLVIFDEPGQQEIENPSLHALLEWSAHSLSDDQQLIMATSEPLANIVDALGTSRANLINFDGFILQPKH
jgi:hypothetical protein